MKTIKLTALMLSLLMIFGLFAGCAGIREKAHTPKPQIVAEPVFLDFPPVEEEYPAEEECDPRKDPYYNNISILSAEERGVYIR